MLKAKEYPLVFIIYLCFTQPALCQSTNLGSTNFFYQKTSIDDTSRNTQPKTDGVNVQTPFNKVNHCQNWAIKGKVLPEMFLIGSGIGASVGVEIGFLKNQSLGVDYVYHFYSFDPADRHDSSGKFIDGGLRQVFEDQAIFLNYRYYLSYRITNNGKGITQYVGTFARMSKVIFLYDKGYVKGDNIIREYHHSIGLIYGALFEVYKFNRLRRLLFIDLNGGIFVKQKEQVHESPDFSGNLTQNSDYPVNVGFRIGLNLSMVFKTD